jgi:hypothetical protein
MSPLTIIVGTVAAFACAITAAWLAGRTDPMAMRRFQPIALAVALAAAAACSYAAALLTDQVYWYGGLAKSLNFVSTTLGLEAVWVVLELLLAGLALFVRRFTADPIFSVVRYFSLSMLGIAVFYFLLTVMDVSGLAKQGGA